MIRFYLLVLIAPFVFQVNINAQTPCESGFAGIYPCNNYDLLSNVPISVLATTAGTPEGSDVWGWIDPQNGKEYAIVATTNSTAFVDVSDPINPIFLGRINTAAGTSFWRDIKVYNNHAFIVADNVGAHGMQVFDLTRLRNVASPPETFTTDAHYTGVGSCHNIVINEDMGYAYLVGCNTFSGGPVFIDISDPINPVAAGGYSAESYTHDAQVITYNGPDTAHVGKEILIGSNITKLVILDITDKNNVIKLSDFTYPQTGYTHQGWFTDDHRYFILGDETDEQSFGLNTRTLVFDFTDLDNPSLSSTYFGPSSAIDHNGYVLGNDFYMANYRAGLRVLDITNISASTNSMTEIGYFDTYPANNGTAFNGAWSVYPYFPSGNIIISDIERGLFVVRRSNTLSIDEEELNSSFSISPNPAVEELLIKASQNQVIESVEIFNTIGQKIYFKNNINLQKYTLDINHNSSGVYYIKINGSFTKKLIIR